MSTAQTRDERDAKTLLEAAKKIRNCAIPHVISEERWTARSANDVVGIRYRSKPVYDIPQNISSAARWLFGNKKSTLNMLDMFEEKPSRVRRLKNRFEMAKHTIKESTYNYPDAEVDGNVVHWMEHAVHIALWSPVVTEAVAVFLEAESKAVAKGERTSATPKALKMARAITKKQVWDDSTSVRMPKPTMRMLIRARNKDARRAARARLDYMVAHEVNPALAGVFYDAYGFVTRTQALKDARRMASRAQKALSLAKTPQSKKTWAERVHASEVFIQALEKESHAS